MVGSRPTTPDLKRELDIPTDVASAMRKSLSHDMFGLSSNNEESSPIGTPGAETPLSGDASGVVNNMRVGGSFVSTGLGVTSADAFPDYQLWNHHITDVKNTASTAATYNNVLEILQEWDFSNSSAASAKPFQRRSSIEDVLKVRQWLNPRSSFAAPSSNEPEIQAPLSRKSTSTNISETGSNVERMGWITLLLSSEDIKPIIALHNSISSCQSKFRLLVLYCAGTDELTEELDLRGIECLPIHPLRAIHRGESCTDEEQGLMWPILSLWREMYEKFDNVCYLSPYTLMSSNMDELLENNDEIDNETCVLLANRTCPPSLLLLKPHDEIHMVLEEFLTFYGVDTEKVARVRSMDDWSILAELFSTSYTLLDDLYGVDVTSIAMEGCKQMKLLDYSKLKPWRTLKEGSDAHSKFWWFNFNNA